MPVPVILPKFDSDIEYALAKKVYNRFRKIERKRGEKIELTELVRSRMELMT